MSEEKAKKTEDVVDATPVVEAVKEAAPVKAVEEKAEEAAPVIAVEEKVEEAAPAKVVEATPTETKEFDWDAYAEGGLALYSKSEYKDYEAMYEATLPEETQAGVIDGTVLNLTDREAIIEIGGKSEGVISLNEFRYNPELKVGDTVEVLIDQQEDKTGQLLLSHRKARSIRSWDRVNSAHDNEEIVNGFVKCRTKGGMIVDVFGIEAFLPGSQIDVKPIRDYDIYVGKTMEFKVVKINHDFKNVVVSHKALIEADIELQKKEIIGKLEKGQVLEGTVKNITSYGVFIDLGGVDGLVHITDLSWNRINHPNEIVELDQKINVVILDFDEAKTRIQLGLKQLSAHPWDALDQELKIGDRVKGKVVVIADYGAFIEILPGVEGLIHVSEMSWSTHLRSAQDFMKVGAEVEAEILTLDRDDRKMSLGLKQLTTDPWADITEKYPAKSKHTGIVRNFTNFGVFIELEEGVDGLVHISDLSWTKKVKHPSEFTSIGAQLEIVVLELDTENRRLSLGHKQVEDNPWDTYETIFAEGSEHEGEVSEVHDKGATVLFKTEGVEGFVPGRHSEKEDGSKIAKGETVKFRVIEFNKGSRKIVLSHTIFFKEALASEKKTTSKNVKSIQSKVEKSTLGDIDALAALKSKLEKGE
ncbi:MAG: 30S ribosomal protein S1 [Flavobacteriales bacterium]|jgi:small subunit ribosomal protein S1|tara:strand:- start:1267 stop:3195 length:1929 start_codon:yes stop_codon:yes gene_type:complete